jgi:hypothetical protein
VGGTDVAGNLSQGQYGNITFGSDLSGSFTKPLFVLGGGRWVADLAAGSWLISNIGTGGFLQTMGASTSAAPASDSASASSRDAKATK